MPVEEKYRRCEKSVLLSLSVGKNSPNYLQQEIKKDKTLFCFVVPKGSHDGYVQIPELVGHLFSSLNLYGRLAMPS